MLVYTSLVLFILPSSQSIGQCHDDGDDYVSVAGDILGGTGPVFLLERVGIT